MFLTLSIIFERFKMPAKIDSSNLNYIDSLFQKYKNNPHSVHHDWRLFFDGVQFSSEKSFSKKELGVYTLINAYREDGHLKARLDPLGLRLPKNDIFKLSKFQLEDQDRHKKFEVFSLLGFEKKFSCLNELLAFLEKTYCSTLALHVGGSSPEIRKWFFQKFETHPFTLSSKLKNQIFEKLVHVEAFEKFLHNRFLGAKRFSIEGSDALIAMLEYSADKSASSGVEELIIGMSHRGRLSVMANFMNQPKNIILSQFEGEVFSEMGFTGDVKYHIGYSSRKKTFSDKVCGVLLGFNPSHLESIVPVICGSARARQRLHKDSQKREKVIPLLIHGDAAFCGQGVVSETLQLSQLKGYCVGGAVHIIVNNQIGFTAEPEEGRSSLYASDLAQSIQAPVLLVNGDDVESAVRAIDIALEFRKTFHQDIVIDLISYRRYGHNEGDEPAFTQPVMYEAIRKHPTLVNIYKNQLIKEGLLKPDDFSSILKQHTNELQKTLDQIRKHPIKITENQLRGAIWPSNPKPSLEEIEESIQTKTQKSILDQSLSVLCKEPESFNLHPKIKRLIQQRKSLIDSGQLDWALAELSAYGSLCLEGHPVRLSGQDSKRGTFSHRHASYFDVKNSSEYIPLRHLSSNQEEFCVYNSPLSEMAVLAFEYGNSCSDHKTLTLWEAQFGDFANGAQIIIDQYISSGEEKWMQSSSLVLLLPHGYEGQGPEHSSARLERFLQLSAQHNMQVCSPTTPANLFHVLRRQVKRNFFKPLILMTPKSLLRHPEMISKKESFTEGEFQEVISSSFKNEDDIHTLILCSGKIYFELLTKFSQIQKSLILRLEQLYPFPKKELSPYVSGLKNLKKIIWLQEEPQNMGAYSFVEPELKNLIEELGLKVSVDYAGRKRKASPAEGSFQVYQKEQTQLINEVIEKTLLK